MGSARAKAPKVVANLSASWEATLLAGKALLSGDTLAAEAAAATAAAAAKSEHTLREKGATAEWQPDVFRSAVRGYLRRHLEQPDEASRAGAAHRAARPAAANTAPLSRAIDKSKESQIVIEQRLKSVYLGEAKASREAKQYIQPGGTRTWERVLTRTWEEPPAEPIPGQLDELRTRLKILQKKHAGA